jgi:hypothetical protein
VIEPVQLVRLESFGCWPRPRFGDFFGVANRPPSRHVFEAGRNPVGAAIFGESFAVVLRAVMHRARHMAERRFAGVGFRLNHLDDVIHDNEPAAIEPRELIRRLYRLFLQLLLPLLPFGSLVGFKFYAMQNLE